MPIQRLRQATVPEINAAVKVTNQNLLALVHQFMDSGFASLYEQQVLSNLMSTAGQQMVVKIVDDALEAAEAVREQETQ